MIVTAWPIISLYPEVPTKGAWIRKYIHDYQGLLGFYYYFISLCSTSGLGLADRSQTQSPPSISEVKV